MFLDVYLFVYFTLRKMRVLVRVLVTLVTTVGFVVVDMNSLYFMKSIDKCYQTYGKFATYFEPIISFKVR